MVDIHEIAQSAGLTIITEDVYDPDTGETLPFDASKVQRALEITARSQQLIADLAAGIHEFFDNKLHLYFGLTKAEAAKKLFNMSVRNVQHLQNMYTMYGDDLKILGVLGMSKLRMLSEKLDEEAASSFAKDGEIELADGSTLPLDEIKDKTVKELRTKLEEVERDKRGLSTQLKEEEKTQKALIRQYESKVEQLESLLAMDDTDKENMKLIKDKKDAFTVIHTALAHVQNSFLTIGNIQLDDPEVVAGIEGLMTYTAKQLMIMVERYGVSLSFYEAAMKTMEEAR